MSADKSRKNVFGGFDIDRLGHLRKNETWLHDTLKSGDSRWLPVWQERSRWMSSIAG